MAEAILSAVLEDLTSMMLSTIKEEVKLVTGVNDEVKALARNLKNIHDLLDEAEEAQLTEASVKNWLFNLKTVSYDMDDVLDEWKTWIQTSQPQLQPHSSNPITLKHKVFSIFRCNCFTMRDIGLRYVIGGRIKELRQMLDDTATLKVRFQLDSTHRYVKHFERLVTTPFVETQKVKGRDVEKDQVKNMILDARSNPHIISLVGLGGIGKTTLAKLIYNDSEIQSHFEKKIWVCVSDPFNVMLIAEEILESLCYSSITLDSGELDQVLWKINAVLSEARFLLILDDVWNESHDKWLDLKQSLMCGLPGSTILVTTRNERVAIVMGCNPENIYKVGLLTLEECWSIICSQVNDDARSDTQRWDSIGSSIICSQVNDDARGDTQRFESIGSSIIFSQVNDDAQGDTQRWESIGSSIICSQVNEDARGDTQRWESIGRSIICSQVNEDAQGDSQRLESIGRKIAEKCKGLPLVANTLGRLLRLKNSEKEWLGVLEKKEWKGSDNLDRMNLSYYNLPSSLKQCFKYCAIFPEGSHNKKKKLIRMWMAQGYLRGKEEDLEIVGETYFNSLIARSLILTVSNDFDDNWFMLHDLVSDLAQAFAEDECLMIEVSNGTEFNENSLRSNANARHLTLVIEKDASFPYFIYGLIKLRSLIIQFLGYELSLAVDVIKDIFDHLTCLRTLDLSNCGIKGVPYSINKLVHLRWLDLSGNTNLKKLPETLCECYNLQTLILENCYNLVELPKKIGKLINLMYLDIKDSYEIKYLPKGIGNLRCLRELTVFIISMNESESFSIVEMEELNNLRGRLEISGLGNVKKVEEARKAQLKEKKSITELSLSFDGDHVQEDEEELLEALEPPSNLEILSIDEFKGKMVFPSWMMKLNLLKKLSIKYSENCKELPPLGKLSCLEELKLRDMTVKRVGVEFMGIEQEKDASISFPKLKILAFELSWEWEEWDDIDEWLMERINNKTITVMPCLQEISIYRCKKLKTLPYHLLSPPITTRLQKLDICDCDDLEQEVQKDKLSHISDLKIRRVHGMPVIRNGNVKNVGSASIRAELEKEKTETLDNLRDVEIVEHMPTVDDNVAEDENGSEQSWNSSIIKICL